MLYIVTYFFLYFRIKQAVAYLVRENFEFMNTFFYFSRYATRWLHNMKRKLFIIKQKKKENLFPHQIVPIFF